MIRWVFLDLGGVLLDESEYHAFMYLTVRELLIERGVTLTESELLAGVRKVVSRDSPHFGFDLPYHFLGDREAAEAVDAAFEDAVRGKDTSLHSLYPEALRVVRSLRARYSLGVVANQRPAMATLLEESGLRPHIDVVVISGVDGVAKPDPAIYELALTRAGCQPKEAVMVGDRVDNDVIPAKALGLWTIRVRGGTWAFQPSRTDAETPDLEIEGLPELIAAMDELAFRG